jgi:hypothetical protein
MMIDLASISETLRRLFAPSSEALRLVQRKYLEMPQETAEAFAASDIGHAVAEILTQEDDIKGLMIRDTMGATNFAFSAGSYIARRALKGDLETALKWLERIVALERAVSVDVMPLWGVDIQRATPLLEDVELVPFDSLPSSYQKKKLQTPVQEKIGRGFYSWSPPTAALTHKSIIEPLFYRSGEEVDLLGDHDRLNAVRLCLTLISPSAVMPAIRWKHFESEELQESALGAGYSFSSMEIEPMALRSFGEFSSDLATKIVSKYFELEAEDRSRIRLAIERFDRAMRRHQAGDVAVELAIALEAILGDGGTELTWKVGLRSALLVSGTQEERVKLRKIVRGIYSLRSTVVHTGSSPSKIKVQGLGLLATDDLIREGAIATAKVIRALIERGKLPNWFEAELGY